MAVTRLHILNMIVLALLGVVILSLSLITANSLTGGRDNIPVGGWQLYVGRRILPDNILYPLVMVQERIKLNQTPPERQSTLMLSYAQERFEVAEALAAENQPGLAITTLSKSQKYIIAAGYRDLEDAGTLVEELKTVRAAIDHSLYRLDLFGQANPQLEMAPIAQLKEETKILLAKVDERIVQLDSL
ncbi:MAG: hypothetical protein COY81_03440 [Candidatus Pacebacteria bacterium CG_4_10_14_0_8_um_filter_43_12]|nr:MAG: hypothetical protein COU66_01695 [Candidatus Pacebacteria bacterium CG10_big_fil_rev_8_21_14_0_10_44_11]PIY79305.1 MAG: hypothetical protein COY81_03440 [Candidatus Pacebacteria bacterium CG_4_10_14_0_8_um_filter_43_12]